MNVRPPLPAVTPDVEAFWHGGASGELRIKRCASCDRLLHPSVVVCPDCQSTDIEAFVASGLATVVGCTTNHQQWHPAFPVPYVLAVVALADDPRVRLTTRVVECEPDDVVVGLPVRVRFEQVDDVWLPWFEPTGEPVAPIEVPLPSRQVRAPLTSERFEAKVALTGIGMSAVGRRLMRPAIALAAEAARSAVDDAGLSLEDIDGISTYPGSGSASYFSEGGVPAIAEALGLHPTWHNGGMDVPGQGGAVIAAMLAVASGLCRHVLCVRTVWETTHGELVKAGRLGAGSSGRIEGERQWLLPFGALSAASWIAVYASQYLARFGANRDMLGWIAVQERANAARNPTAVYTEPITLDDYYAARPISTPFGLLDCDVPCDGSVAVIVSAVDAARDARHRPVLVDAIGSHITERQSWDQGTLTHEPNTFGPAAHLWSRSTLAPAEVDVALLYDGFTFNCISWLEALGFCGVGEAAEFLDGGRRIALDGELPLNPHGGQLSAGRLHGFGFLHEAVTQLRGDAGARQIDDAEVAVVTTGGGTPGGCFLLVRGR